ncbi:DUF1566 domain-containing protein [Maribellus sediminis]|uniref:DUF1566 domain-containing protein n=1 Tax=Maribellus sediminis TaxID=2696285 RepID=UPI00142F8E25|nr:DUF1566 domain-containing protein [Maribellus sediminis]
MKKTVLIISALLLIITSWAQSPEKLSYQAIIRNDAGQLVANQEVGMQISILEGSIYGASIYVETQTATTNSNGLVSIQIGSEDANVMNGVFSDIDWSKGTYIIKTQTDPTGGTNYTITGTSQLLSVPYALYAKTAETVTGGISEADPLYAESEAAKITASDITNLGNLSGVNTGDQDLSNLATKSAVIDTAAAIRATLNSLSVTSGDETDPVFAASEAVNITTTDITNLSNLSGVNTGDQDLSQLATIAALQDSVAAVRTTLSGISGSSPTESDPVFTASEAANITAAHISKLGNLSGINTGDQDLSSYAKKADVLSLNNSSAFTPDNDYEPATKKYVDDQVASTSYVIGDFAFGGIVFWVDDSGQHGLVCAKEDQSAAVRWDGGTNGNTRAMGDGAFAGAGNTFIIIAATAAIGDDGATYAARVSNELQITEGSSTYGNWYLPSAHELSLMYASKDQINTTATANSGSAFAADSYWSSTEVTFSAAKALDFTSGSETSQSKSNTHGVRAIRAF